MPSLVLGILFHPTCKIPRLLVKLWVFLATIPFKGRLLNPATFQWLQTHMINDQTLASRNSQASIYPWSHLLRTLRALKVAISQDATQSHMVLRAEDYFLSPLSLSKLYIYIYSAIIPPKDSAFVFSLIKRNTIVEWSRNIFILVFFFRSFQSVLTCKKISALIYFILRYNKRDVQNM